MWGVHKYNELQHILTTDARVRRSMFVLHICFRKCFRKPSRTFRNAGFEHLSYGCYLRDQFGDQILLLTSPTYFPHENIECMVLGTAVEDYKRTQKGPWATNDM